MSKRIKHNLILIAATVVAFSLTFTSIDALAWFSAVFSGSRKVEFTSSEGTLPDLHAWKFDVNDEASGMTFIKDGHWVDAMDTNSTSTPKAIMPVLTYPSGSSIQEIFQFTSLHLGTVDNLLELCDDNFFFVRLDVTGDLDHKGHKARVSYALNSNNVHFYDQSGTDQTQLANQSYGITGALLINEFLDLFVAECVISTTAYDPTTNAAQATSLKALFEGNSAIPLTRNAAPTELTPNAMTTDYYIYFRFHPDLGKCFDATETITIYMPCEILYDVMLNVELYDIRKS